MSFLGGVLSLFRVSFAVNLRQVRIVGFVFGFWIFFLFFFPPFPGDCARGGGRSLGLFEAQPLLRELLVLLGFSGVGAQLFLESFAAFELAEPFGQRCLPEVSVSGPVKVQQHV